MTSHDIGKYTLQYNAYSGNDADYIARISLYSTQNQHVGTIDFYKAGQSIPNNAELPGKSGTPFVYLRMTENQLDRIVDMLRNEKPCGVYYDSPTFATVVSGVEPIGEGES